MSFEVEFKFPRGPEDGLEARLATAGFVLAEARTEADRYFNAPHRDFAKSDEALRLRQAAGKNVLTYKGPKQGTVGKTRLELEAPLQDGPEPAETLCRILIELGYRETAVVRKARRLFRPAPAANLPPELELTLDEVEGVGSFVEIERKADAASATQVQAELLALAKQLGLGQEERRSYLELLLTRPAKGGAA